MEQARGFSHGWATVICGVWLAGAIAAGWLGLLEPLPRPVVQGILLGLTGALVIGAFLIAPTRAWVRTLPLRALIGLHITRIAAGTCFLLFLREGRLPREFAQPGGWGDIAVGALAIALLWIGPETARGRGLAGIWNLLGFVDILFVVFTAARLGLKDASSMVELTRLPLCVLPLFLVPLIIASHIVIFRRLRGSTADEV